MKNALIVTLTAASLLTALSLPSFGNTCPTGQVWSQGLNRCVDRRSNGNGDLDDSTPPAPDTIEADCKKLQEMDPTIPCQS